MKSATVLMMATACMALACGASNPAPKGVDLDLPSRTEAKPNQAPKRTAKRAKPKTLVTSEGECRAMFVHGSDVYWFAVKMWDDATLYKVPITGGDIQKVALVNDEFRSVRVGGVLDGKLVFGNTVTVLYVPLDAGFVNYGKSGVDYKTVEMGGKEYPTPSSIATDGEQIFWTQGSGGKVLVVDKNFKGPKVLVEDAKAEWADQLMSRDKVLYWVTHNNDGKTSFVRSRNQQGDSEKYLVPSQEVHIDVVGRDIFATISLGEGKGTRIAHEPNAAGEWKTFHESPHAIADMVVLQDKVYVLAVDDEEMTVQGIDVADGKATDLATLEGTAGDGELVMADGVLYARNECNLIRLDVSANAP